MDHYYGGSNSWGFRMLLLAFWGSRKIHGSGWPVGPTSSKKQKKPNWRSLLSYHIISHIISYHISYHIILYYIVLYSIIYYIILYYVILYLIVDLPPGFGIWDFNRSTVYIIVDHCYLILQYIPSSPSTSWGQKHPWSATFFSVAFQLLKIWQITVDPRGISWFRGGGLDTRCPQLCWFSTCQ